MPVTESGLKAQPVSSSVSRTTASASDSPGSRWPAGWFSTTRRAARSCTNRNRPLRSAMAATVMSSFRGIEAIITGRGRAPLAEGTPRRNGTGAKGARPLLEMLLPCFGFRLARDPDLIEVVEVAPRDEGVVHLEDSLPAGGLETVDEGAVVGDQEGRLVVAAVGLHAANLDVARDAAREVDELAALVDDPRRVREQHAHLGIALREHELLHRLEELGLVVDGRVERSEERRGGKDTK